MGRMKALLPAASARPLVFSPREPDQLPSSRIQLNNPQTFNMGRRLIRPPKRVELITE